MYATFLKAQCHHRVCGPGPRLDELIVSALNGQAMDAWEEQLAETPVWCLGPGQAFNEPQITTEQVAAVRAGL